MSQLRKTHAHLMTPFMMAFKPAPPGRHHLCTVEGRHSGWSQLGTIEQARVYPARGGFWNAVDRMRLLAAHTNLNHTGIVLHKLSDGLPTQSPYA
jgi:hypothetical protein